MEEARTVKRILIIADGCLPHGGGDCAVKEITDRLISPDVEFQMITRGHSASLPAVEWIGNILVYRIGVVTEYAHPTAIHRLMSVLNRYRFYMAATLKARRLHREVPYDAVWAVGARSAGIPAVLFTRTQPEVGYVQTLNEQDVPEDLEKSMRLTKPLFRRMCTAPNFIQATSTSCADWARRMGATCPVYVIPDGVSLAPFSAHIPDATLASLRTRLGKKEGEVFLVSISPVTHQSGIDTIVDALSLLPEYVKYACIGAGSDEALVRTQVAARKLENRVVFVGEVSDADIPAYVRVCDIFVCPNKLGGTATSCVKAMASAMPVVGTREGGVADLLFDEKSASHESPTGWVVEKGQSVQIADAVRDILENPEKVERVLANARAYVAHRYSWDTIALDMRERIFAHLYTARAYTGK